MSRIGKTISVESRLTFGLGQKEKLGVMPKYLEVYFGGNENVLKLLQSWMHNSVNILFCTY
jgi:hypothetical protein